VWFQIKNDETGVQDKAGFIFFFMTFWLFNAAFSGMMGFPPERAVLMKVTMHVKLAQHLLRPWNRSEHLDLIN
jgi:hypothetical protein